MAPLTDAELRQWIVANFENPDLTHQAFRVEAFMHAASNELKQKSVDFFASIIAMREGDK